MALASNALRGEAPRPIFIGILIAFAMCGAKKRVSSLFLYMLSVLRAIGVSAAFENIQHVAVGLMSPI